MPGVNRVLYNLDQRGETTPEERATARRNIDAISADEVAILFDDHYKVKQSPINMTFAANAVLHRLWQNPNGEIGAECNYIYDATQSASGFMSPADKTKLDGIAYGAEVNVQSDWNVTDDTSDAFIRNKPNLNMFVTHDELGARLDAKQDRLTPGRNITIENNVISATADPQEQADWAQTDSSAVDYIKNKPQNLVQDADYVHTDNNFTTAEKNKLMGIEPGAEVNVKPDWDAAVGSDAEILNKPQNLVQDADYHHTDNNFTTAEKNKLSGIEAGAEANVQADWAQANSSADDFIKNKPDLSVYATQQDLTTGLSGKQDTLTAGNNITITNNVISASADPQVQADWAQSDSAAVDYIKNKPQNLVQDPSYVHTDNNFTNADKTKLDSVESGAEANVQADWAQTNSSADDFIKNKPANLVQDASYVHTDNNFTTAEKTKLAGIEAGAEVNVQADWSQSDSSADDYIKNKPTNLVQDASYVHTDNNFTTSEKDKLAGIAAGAEVNVQADWTEADSAADSFIKHKPNLATVATTGSYNDLTDRPSIPSVPVQGVEVDGTSVVNAQGVAEIDLTPYAKSADLATVATSGSYNDLTDKPSIPAAQVNSDWNAVSGVAQILNKPNLAAVATSGDYNDLSNKPVVANFFLFDPTYHRDADLWNAWIAHKAIFLKYHYFIPEAEVEGIDALFPLEAVLTSISNGHTVYTFRFTEISSVSAPGVFTVRAWTRMVDPTDLTISHVMNSETVRVNIFEVTSTTTQRDLYLAIAEQNCIVVYRTTGHNTYPLVKYVEDVPGYPGSGFTCVFARVGCSSLTGPTLQMETVTVRMNDAGSHDPVVITTNAPVGFPLMQWQQQTQGATNTYSADKLTINQDSHTVTMHDATNGDVDLGYVVPVVAVAQPTNKILTMASGNTVPTWSDAPEGHTVGFITVP